MAHGITPEKARKILRDGKIRGKPLTPAQRRFFGLIAGGGKPVAAQKGKWIQGAIRKPGRIRKLLGKKPGEKITMAELRGLRARAKGDRSLQSAISLAERFVSGGISRAAEGISVQGLNPAELIRIGFEEEHARRA